MPEMTLSEAIHQALDEELARDNRVVLLGEDIGRLGGIFRVTHGLLEKYGPERVIDAPLAENALVGAAVGAALWGMRPICEIQFADVLPGAFQQIVNEAARIHYRSNGAWCVPLVVRAPYGGGTGGGLYTSQSPEAFFTHVPGLKVVVPSSPRDARALLKAAIRDPNPVLFLEPRQGYRSLTGEVPEEEETLPLGKAAISRSGNDLTVITYGMMHAFARQAADHLAESEGIQAEVIDLHTLYPLDLETLFASVARTSKALVIHEASRTGGYGAEVAAELGESLFEQLDAPVRRLAGPDLPGVPFARPLHETFMLDQNKIEQAMRDLAEF